MPEVAKTQAESLWQTQSLRLTTFPELGQEIDSSAWWANIVDEAAEQRVTQPRFQRTVETGTFKGGELTLSLEPGRIDWNYTAKQDLAAEEEAPPIIGAFQECLKSFSDVMKKWLAMEVFPSNNRIAIGGILLIPVPDRKAGYDLLQGFLDAVKIDSSNSTDFLYQINRPRDTRLGIPELRINRLSKWSVFASVLNSLQFSATHVSSTTSIKNLAARLEFDINTIPEFPLVSHRERILEIFDELLSLAVEVSIRGDTP